MSIAFFCWLVPVLLAAELGAVAYLRRDRYPRFLFHFWAPTLYAALILADFALAALLTWLVGGDSPEAAGQRAALFGWAVVAGLATVAVALLSLFFRWVTHTDITDLPD